MFADLDVTAIVFDGAIPYSCQRGQRAVVSRTSFVPRLMLHNRDDTPYRLGKYVQRGVTMLSRDVEGTDAPLVKKAVEHSNHCKKKFLDTDVFFTYTHRAIEPDALEAFAADYLSSNNTHYSEVRLPRGYGVTNVVLNKFIQLMKMKSNYVMAATVGVPENYELEHKLESRERWWRYGMISER